MKTLLRRMSQDMAFERIANAETTFLKSPLVTKGLAWWYEKAADLVLNGLVVFRATAVARRAVPSLLGAGSAPCAVPWILAASPIVG